MLSLTVPWTVSSHMLAPCLFIIAASVISRIHGTVVASFNNNCLMKARRKSARRAALR